MSTRLTVRSVRAFAGGSRWTLNVMHGGASSIVNVDVVAGKVRWIQADRCVEGTGDSALDALAVEYVERMRTTHVLLRQLDTLDPAIA